MSAAPTPAPTAPLSFKRRAPTLYGIAMFKLAKGLIFLLLGLGVYTLSDNNLPAELHGLLEWFRLNPESAFFARLSAKVARITESNMLWVAGGTMAYSALAWVEGIGLFMRLTGAAWLAIAESALFIPIEIYELSKGFSWGVAALLGLNIIIVCYLVSNRHRLFRHLSDLRHHHHAQGHQGHQDNPANAPRKVEPKCCPR